MGLSETGVSGNTFFGGMVNNYNKNYGNTAPGVGWTNTGSTAVGVVTDATKSGIESETNNNVKYIIKY